MPAQQAQQSGNSLGGLGALLSLILSAAAPGAGAGAVKSLADMGGWTPPVRIPLEKQGISLDFLGGMPAFNPYAREPAIDSLIPDSVKGLFTGPALTPMFAPQVPAATTQAAIDARMKKKG